MKRYGLAGLICFGLSLLSGTVLHASVINLGTGQSPGTVDTASDPIWMIIGAPSGSPNSGPAVLIGNPIWGPAPAGLHWIATEPGPNSGGPQYPAGDYTYEVTFNGSSGSLGFSVKADNAVDVFLNGSIIPLLSWGDPTGTLPTGWATFSPVQNVNTGFQAVNHLDLVVHNPSVYTGVLLQGQFEMSGTNGTPEPATWSLLAAGIGLVLFGKSSRRSTNTRE
jgi:hypothetical protein